MHRLCPDLPQAALLIATDSCGAQPAHAAFVHPATPLSVRPPARALPRATPRRQHPEPPRCFSRRSEAARRRWQDPAYRAKMRAARGANALIAPRTWTRYAARDGDAAKNNEVVVVAAAVPRAAAAAAAAAAQPTIPASRANNPPAAFACFPHGDDKSLRRCPVVDHQLSPTPAAESRRPDSLHDDGIGIHHRTTSGTPVQYQQQQRREPEEPHVRSLPNDYTPVGASSQGLEQGGVLQGLLFEEAGELLSGVLRIGAGDSITTCDERKAAAINQYVRRNKLRSEKLIMFHHDKQRWMEAKLRQGEDKRLLIHDEELKRQRQLGRQEEARKRHARIRARKAAEASRVTEQTA